MFSWAGYKKKKEALIFKNHDGSLDAVTFADRPIDSYHLRGQGAKGN